MEEKKNQISFVDLIILQFLWICQSVYESILSVFKWPFRSETTPALENTKMFHEKRHFIQLFTTESKNQGGKPICYMKVTEFDSSQEEEIRKRNFSQEKTSTPFLRYNSTIGSENDNDLQKFYCSSFRF